MSTRPTRAARTWLHDGESLARALEKIEAYAKQVPMDVHAGTGHGVHREPAHRAQGGVRQPVQHAPAHRRAHRPPAQPPVLSRLLDETRAALSIGWGDGPAVPVRRDRRRRCSPRFRSARARRPRFPPNAYLAPGTYAGAELKSFTARDAQPLYTDALKQSCSNAADVDAALAQGPAVGQRRAPRYHRRAHRREREHPRVPEREGARSSS